MERGCLKVRKSHRFYFNSKLNSFFFFCLLYCLSNCIMAHLRTVGNVFSNSELRQPNAANKICSSVFVCLLYGKDFFAEKYPTILKERHFLLNQ